MKPSSRVCWSAAIVVMACHASAPQVSSADRFDAASSTPTMVPIAMDSHPLTVDEAATTTEQPDAGASADAQVTTVTSPHRLRWVYRGATLSVRTPEIVPILSGPTGRFRLGGMSMDFFQVNSCDECPALGSTPQPLGMPPDSFLRFSDRRELIVVGGGPVWAVELANCPTRERCTRPQAIPPGSYTAELAGGTFQCPTVSVRLPLTRDVTVTCRSAARATQAPSEW